MSVPAPMCPRCGQWMRPTDLHEDGEKEKPIVGVCWKCPCGYQMPIYREGYWEEQERRAEEQEEAERREELAAIAAEHPDRYKVLVRGSDGVYAAIATFPDDVAAVAWARTARPGRDYRIYRQVYDPVFECYIYTGAPCAEGTA